MLEYLNDCPEDTQNLDYEQIECHEGGMIETFGPVDHVISSQQEFIEDDNQEQEYGQEEDYEL